MGALFSLSIVPKILVGSWVKAILNLRPSATSFLLMGIYFFLLSLIYKPSLSFYKRYRNNFRLGEIPFTYIDALSLFIASSVTTAFIFHWRLFGDVSVSGGLKPWLIILGISLLLWCLVIIFKSRSHKVLPSQYSAEVYPGDFFPDEPITSEKDDLLDRKPFVGDLYNQITKYPSSDSFVFGLYGSWGEGKTSVLNLLKNKLYLNEGIIVFEYGPWYFSSQDALIKGFYEGLYASLNRIFFLPNIKRTFIRYQKILSWGLKVSGIDFNIGLINESLEEMKEKIQYWISLTGKKIVILVDDLDRLHDKSEILQILKIVKLSGRFKKTIFVLSFDPGIVSSCLKDDISKDPLFLDKIIQSPIHLPAVNQAIIDRYLFYSYPDQGHVSGIDRLFKNLEIGQERIKSFDKDFPNLYESQIKRLFSTLRQAKRYLNGLYSTLPAVKNEVNLQDFLILELIRIFYLDLYEDIWDHPWYYIPSSWSTKLYISSPLTFTIDKKQKLEKIRGHINDIVSKQNNSEVLLELLKTIFFVEVKNAIEGREVGYDAVANQYRVEKRITHPDVFPKYFMMKVPPEEISDETIESLIFAWDSTNPADLEFRVIEDFKKFKQERKLLELLDKLPIFLPRFETHIAKSFIGAIYKNIHLFSKEGRENLWHSEFDRAEFLMIHLINEKIEKTEIEPILIEIIRDTPSFELAVLVVLGCRKERGGNLFTIYDNIRIEHLHQILSGRLSRHFIDGGKNIFEEEKENFGFILYQWGTANQEDRQKVNDYVFSLIDSNPKYLSKIISRFITNWGEPIGREIDYDALIKLYDEKRLYEKIKGNYSNAHSNQEEKSGVDLFIKVYEERQKSALGITRQDANKQQFLRALNSGRNYFEKGKFNEALEELNRALLVKDWKDDHDWMAQARYEKWKCLLEMSWNNGNPAKESFVEACKLAGNEAQIKALVDSSYKGGTPDRAPIEHYYCLFYVLQWYFAEEPERLSIRDNFLPHYEIATGGNTPGRSEKITARCNELLNRIDLKT